ncbi:MFS transporter [Novosphingobium aquiterrae]|uniref:MFS transporter n=1 Tax=Novosphingobium aquiterrae TaxID=624388 RepID=A0ABV6PEJ4_9SPHN
MPAAVLAERSAPVLALSEHRKLRFAMLGLLYFAQGLPFGLFDFALPAWLAQHGASAAAIGSVQALIILPWTFKLAYGLLMDRYAFLAMGRRRPWIIIGQAGLALAFLALALANPGVQQIGLIAAFGFVLGLSSAVQDVAVDGLAVDILPGDEIERVNGYMFGAQALGIAASSAVSGYLIAWFSLPVAVLTLAAAVTAILLMVVAIRERPGEKLLPWTRGAPSQRNLDLHLGAFGPILRSLGKAMFTRQTLILVPALIAVVAAWGIFLGAAPLFAAKELGWGKAIYSSWSGQANIVAGIAGALVFGGLAGRWGPRRTFIASALLTATAGGTMYLAQGHWTNPAFFIAAILTFNILVVLRSVAAGALAMRLCAPAIAATQFAVFMAILNLGRSLASASLGWLDSLGGLPAMFIAIVVCGVTAAIFAFAAKVGR